MTIFQPTLSCRRRAVSASTLRSCGLSTPVCLPPLVLLEFLDGRDHALADFAGDRAVILADPGEIRLDRETLGLRHRVGGIGGGLQRGADRNGRDRFGLVPPVDGAVICACAEAPAATNINVAVSIDLMTSLGVIDVGGN